jgi:hypothetical protein
MERPHASIKERNFQNTWERAWVKRRAWNGKAWATREDGRKVRKWECMAGRVAHVFN